MSWKNIKLILFRELRDQLRDRRTLFMITILPVLLYPMLGLGVVEMFLLLGEQPKNVVVLNADQFPDQPAFLDLNYGIDRRWLSDESVAASQLRITTDETRDPGTLQETPDENPLLTKARELAARIQNLNTENNRRNSSVTVDLRSLETDLSTDFANSNIHVLILVPSDYSASMQRLREQAVGENSAVSFDELPAVMVVRNSADDKSMAAFARIRESLEKWEDQVRDSMFSDAQLPAALQNPARLAWVETAQQEQVAASVWSKLFPTMLVIMALTGAFYPAVDLGAGEKERGTMETLLISPARRVEIVLGKFLTVMLFSIVTAVLNLASMGITGQKMASALGGGMVETVNLEFPGFHSLFWLVVLLIPLAALFSAICLALAAFAKSTKEGQYYLTPLLMVVMMVTMFCVSPAFEIGPFLSIVPVVNIALLLKGLLLPTAASTGMVYYVIPVLVSSIGYSLLALWWAIELYSNENVLFREAEKFELRLWVRHLLRDKEAVPALSEAGFCFVIILLLQFAAMTYLQTDMNSSRSMLQGIVVQQLVTIACPAVFMALMLTTSLRATLRLRIPKLRGILTGVGLALLVHPLTVEFSQFLVHHEVFPPSPPAVQRAMALMQAQDLQLWQLLSVFALAPAICEELAFRGFILSGLARGGRLAIAIGISSIMFGIIHMIPQQAFNAALLGLVLGLLAVHTRSLLPAIAFHFVNNAMALLHARGGFGLEPGGTWVSTFLSRDVEGALRYEPALLILCAAGVAWLCTRMISDLVRQQAAKRRELPPMFTEAVAAAQ